MSVLFGSQAALDPEALRRACEQVGADPSPFWGRANAFTLRAGYEPSSGHIILSKSALDALDLTRSHTLTFVGADTARVSFAPVTLLDHRSVLSGAEADGAQALVCALADRRHFLKRVPFDAGFKGYNVEAAAGGSRLSGTLNGGAAWTWQEVVDDLATLLGEDAAEFVLPFTPDGTPENLVFDINDVPGPWAALCHVLDRLGCAAVLDPTTDTFSVVRQGEGMSAALQAVTGAGEYAGAVWDEYPAEPARAWRPEKVRVLFPRRPQPTTGAAPYHAEDVTLAATAGVEAGTFAVLADDLTADGATGAPTNAAALATRAAERAADWLRVRGTYGRPVARAWRDFQGAAVGLVGVWADRVTYDDRGGEMRTWATQESGADMEAFRPLGKWPVWWPLSTTGGSGSITAEEADGSPSYASTTTLRFDQSDGFVLSQPGAGIARVDLADATASQAGKVSTSAQTFAGLKTFNAGIIALDGVIGTTYLLPPAGAPIAQLVVPNILATAPAPTATTPPQGSSEGYVALVAADTYGAYLLATSQPDSTHGTDLWVFPQVATPSVNNHYTGRFVVTGRYAAWVPDGLGSGTVHTGGSATTGGLTFVNGLYISGTASGYTAGGTDVAVADGGTGASTASGARTNLGLGTAAEQNVAYFLQAANDLSDLSSAATARTNLGVTIGTDVQAYSARLDTLAAGTSSAVGTLTDSTGGTAGGTISDVGASFSQSTLNDNLASLTARLNDLITALQTAGVIT